VVQRLKDSDPRVFATDMLAPFGMLFVSSVNLLHEEQAKATGQLLKAALKG
jgi:hypothetical protein